MARVFRFLAVLLVAVGLSRGTAYAAPVLNEFLAVNQGGLADEDGESADWIELHNSGPTWFDLTGWALTDAATNLTQWRFPATNLPAGGFLVVFASGKDRRIPGRPLHTNFRLSSSGDYLALVSPAGQPTPPVFSPAYRAQFPNVSYGLAAAATLKLLEATAPVQALVPLDGKVGANWRLPEFTTLDWLTGTGGAGYETSPADYAGLIGLDLGPEMQGHNSTVFLRFPFTVNDPASLTQLRLLIQYDDGFVAWLNGREVARRNATDPLTWNSSASGDHPDGLAVIPEDIDLTPFLPDLVPGANVLAIQGFNVSLSSSDLLVRAELEADRVTKGTSEAFFTQPTPGTANRGGTPVLGPLIQDVQHTPKEPSSTEAIAITTRVDPTLAPVSTVSLFHRVRFSPEISTPMFDDGLHGDGAKNDRVYGAFIPAGAAPGGELIRYRVEATDTAAELSGLPLFFDPIDSAQYFGFVLTNPGITSALPVLHLFVQNVGASESFAGTRASLAYLGQFYDNLEIRVHGQSSSGFPKKSFNLDFNRDHRFRYATNRPRVKDLKLLTNYGDKSRLHNTLAYETIDATGSRGHFAFPVRVQRNGTFHGVLDVVEDGDDRWLERLGLSSDGALYKVYDALENAGGSEKKTRKEEGNSDLQNLINGVSPSRTLAARATYAYDNLDLPQVVSYFVALAVVSSQDHGHKNYYVHRDTTGSGDWSLLPWDVDLTFGRNWTDSGGYFTDTLYTNNVLNFYNSSQQGKPANRLYSLIFSQPEFRGMYLRRLRSVMDTVLQSPETPADERKIEARIRFWLDQLDPSEVGQSDADLDQAKWGSWGVARNTRAEAQRIIDVYLPGRRNFLYNSARAALNGEQIPAAQATQVAVKLDELDFNPVSGRQTEEYLRLTNSEPVAVDLSGWSLRGQVRHTFRPGTVIPAGKTLYVSPDVSAFRSRSLSPKRGENSFVQGNYDGQLSARGGEVQLLDGGGAMVSTLRYGGAPTPLQQALRLSELMFHPAAPTAGSPFDDEDFEFIELKNLGAEPLNLLGAKFNEGITFTFTNAATATVPPGGRALVVRNSAAFTSRYGPGLPVLGEYLGSLDNAGESLRLQDAQGETVFDFQYHEEGFGPADGGGFSLEPVSAEADLELASSWRLSRLFGGSPGRTRWAPPIERMAVTAESLHVSCRAELGNQYRLEGRTTLKGQPWAPLTAIQSGSEYTMLEFSIPRSSAESPWFLRVGQP